jgi:hypothetical protein
LANVANDEEVDFDADPDLAGELDYGEDMDLTEGAPTEERLAAVVALARQQVEVEDEVARLTAALEDATKRLRVVAETELPAALEQAGLASFALATGERIGIEEKVVASITKENAGAAHAWLRDEGHGDLIKVTVTAAFGRGMEPLATRLLELVRQQPWAKKVKLDEKEGVHYQTLGAFVREQLKLGTELPEAITVLQLRKAVVTRPAAESAL